MNVVMSYIDYNMAGLAEREIFSPTKTATKEIYGKLKKNPHIRGAVLIATCNRTELYLSLSENVDIVPFTELCNAIGVDGNTYKKMSKTLYKDEVISHLCKVASGAESQIWGEDQIVTQVGDAIRTAQSLKVSDSILNVMFRIGVTAGKKVKTLVDFKVHDNSTASKAVSLIKSYENIDEVMVIGNGMIGRLVAENLVRAGKKTTMTLRHYKYGENIIPKGVNTIFYGDRYEALPKVDAVISSTLSPHYTLTLDKVKEIDNLPKIFIDLAVPRDIDPDIADLNHVNYYNVDSISSGESNTKKKEKINQIENIIKKYIDDFYHWYSYRESIQGKGR